MTAMLGKKRVFVGSSTEGRPIAEKVLAHLQANGLSTLPWYDFFHNSRPPLQELEHLTQQVDGAVLVATADDQVVVRERQWHQARDNVLFEYGLFAGAIGRRKCGLLIPDIDTFRIPSDFLGVGCCVRFQVDAPDAAVARTTAALAGVLSRPPGKERLEVRGRRVLRLLGWIRDETFRLMQEWEPDQGRSVIVGRVIAVSAFIQEDVDKLGVRKEYDEIERLMIAAIDEFPEQSAGGGPGELDGLIREWLPGRVRPNDEVFGALLANLQYHGLLDYYAKNCFKCSDQFSLRRRQGYWEDREYWIRLVRDDWPYYDHPRLCGPVAWAAGVAEAAAAFERHLYPLRALNVWSRRTLPQLNDAILTFERRLHERIFGPL